MVEMAFVLPVFFLFLFALFEFSHAYMTINLLNAACKRAARLGVTEGVTTTQVEARVREILSTAFDSSVITVQVKDASVFDSGNVNAGGINYGALPGIELATTGTRQLFVVRAEVPYDRVAIVPPFYAQGLVLSGQSVMRHE